MGKLKYLFVAMLFAPLFMSCEEEETVNMGKATIEFDEAITEARVVEGVLTPAVSGSVTAPEGAVIESITVTVTYTDGENSIPLEIAGMSDMNKVNDGKYEFYYTEESDGISAVINDLTKIEIVAKVVDGESSSASVAVVFESATPTPLSASKTLQWVRDGGGTATGLSEFGLAWTSNQGSTSPFHAIIKKNDNTKLVELTSAQWNSIETVEALKSAVDGAQGITDYRGIRADAGGSYNVVLAVNVDGAGDYKIIHITSATAGPGTVSGTKTTINGQYKDANVQIPD